MAPHAGQPLTFVPGSLRSRRCRRVCSTAAALDIRVGRLSRHHPTAAMRAVSVMLLTVSLSLHLWPTIPTLPGAAPLADHSDAASRPRATSLATLPAAALWAGARDAREQQDAAWLHLRGGGPKKAGGAKSAKQQQAKAKKFVEDKTFGLKNKNKSKKVQQFVKTVQAQVSVCRLQNKSRSKTVQQFPEGTAGPSGHCGAFRPASSPSLSAAVKLVPALTSKPTGLMLPARRATL